MHIEGNLCEDPTLNFTTSNQTPVARIRVATDERIQVDGNWESRPQFFTVVCWQALGENVAHSLSKGMRVSVTGRVRNREYQPEAGDKRYFTEIIAEDVSVSLKWAVVGNVEKATKAKELVAPNGEVVEEPF